MPISNQRQGREKHQEDSQRRRLRFSRQKLTSIESFERKKKGKSPFASGCQPDESESRLLIRGPSQVYWQFRHDHFQSRPESPTK